MGSEPTGPQGLGNPAQSKLGQLCPLANGTSLVSTLVDPIA